MKAIKGKKHIGLIRLSAGALSGKEEKIMIQIQKEDNWEVPEGIVSAVLREMRVIEKVVGGKVETVLRPVFQVTGLNSPRYNFVVAKNYSLSDTSKLKADFVNWLGDSFYDLADANGKISREAFDTLVGKKADLQVAHIPNEGYKAPFCHVVAIAPSGTLTDLN